jgi:hypothetical protein
VNARQTRRRARIGALSAVTLVAVAAAGAVPAGSANVALATPEAGPNEVVKWNLIAQNTVLAQAPNVSSPNAAWIYVAMVQGAVHGAVNAIDGKGRPYLIRRTSDHDASKRAAAATAAFTVLDTLFPAQHAALQAEYDASLAAVDDGPREDDGIAMGEAAAAAMLAGGHDARTGPVPDLPPDGPGNWEPLLGPTGTPALDPAAWVALAPTFIVKDAAQFRTEGPRALTSAAYAAEVNEVKALGSTTSTVRTPTQTHVAIFWQSNPAATWNGVARRLAEEQQLSLSESADLFAMLNLSAADATITCWNDKYVRGFWRPMAAIREADTDGNALTEADPTWTPLFTPPYPEHPSGHLCMSASSLNAMRGFFGTDEMPFYVTSAQFPGEQRHFERFSDAVAELIEARIWAGLHFRTADEQGERLGREVARYVRLHYFQPTP